MGNLPRYTDTGSTLGFMYRPEISAAKEDRWRQLRRCVYRDNIDTGEDIAIKLEYVSIDPFLLEGEVDTYQSLSGGAGILRVYAYKTEYEYNAIVVDLLGPSLEDLFNCCGRQFSLKTVLILADQLIGRLKYIYSKSVIYRDIKPENFLIGVGKHRNYVKANAGRAWIPYLIGTARFASINGHLGIVQHRCDNLESLGYMLLYFLRGSLLWQGLTAADQTQKEELILKEKETVNTKDLCEDIPGDFAAYFDYTYSLAFDEEQKYSYLRRIFRDLFVREGFYYNHVFDWTILEYLRAT
ncbi:serine/threonine protein kinase [Mycoblastus sanguinarius]|nr:serine/threonine protein kinase [Mycoblastus sanguinarius]